MSSVEIQVTGIKVQSILLVAPNENSPFGSIIPLGSISK